jgi:hypothetical protein
MSKDYERKVQTSETLIEVAMIRLLVVRLVLQCHFARSTRCELAPQARSSEKPIEWQ